MLPKTIILMGKSGAGKGTQAKMLCENLSKTGEVIYLETGSKFRAYIQEDSHSANLSKKIMDAGERQPEFLAVVMWGNLFLEKIKTGKEHIVIDGAPRALAEALVLETAFKFFDRKRPDVFVLGIPDRIVTRRMIRRGRADDNEKDIRTRLSWFKEDVMPAILYLKEQKEKYNFHVIQASKDPKSIQEEILSKI